MSPPEPVVSYTTISPITCSRVNRAIGWYAFCCTRRVPFRKARPYLLGSGMPCAVRTFLTLNFKERWLSLLYKFMHKILPNPSSIATNSLY